MTDRLQTAPWRERALAVFPGGSSGEFGLPPEPAPVIERGAGASVWDTEGREYLDFTMAWGAALVGHAHPKVIEAATAATAAARDGANFAAVNRRAVELAERLAALSPCAERVGFVASGAQATLLCLRVAHAATGRPKVLRFAGAAWVERDALVAPYNDLAASAAIVSAYATELAAVIVEPLHRCLTPMDGFLAGLRELTSCHRIALIFDEVVTGFRLALGGAQEYYGVIPDLVACRQGPRRRLPHRRVCRPRRPHGRGGRTPPDRAGLRVVGVHAGGNPVSCAAALATLEVLSAPGVYPRLHQAGRQFRDLLGGVLRAQGMAAQVPGDGPLGQVAFAAHPVVDQRAWLASDRAFGRRLMLELFRRRIFLNPMGAKLYLSLAHTDDVIEAFLERFAAALTTLHPASVASC